VIPLVADALGWRSLIATRVPLPARSVVFARWIGESVNGLLPVAQVGGNVVKANIVARRGMPGTFAGATVVVDVTTLVGSQVAFTLLGLAFLLVRIGGSEVATTALVGSIAMGLAVAGFYLLQRRGGFGWLARRLAGVVPGELSRKLAAGAGTLDQDVAWLYARGRALGRAFGWHLASWIVGTGEVWLALYFLGHPVDLGTAFLLESLGQAIRAAAFAVPGALGVQEAGFVLLGPVLAVAPETALALSLAKRVRELALGLPGLVAWQIEEANALLLARTDGTRMESPRMECP